VIEQKIEKRRANVYGPPVIGKQLIALIDDVSMPARDKFGV